MHCTTFIGVLSAVSASLIPACLAAIAGTSTNRGLIYIPAASRHNWPASYDDDWKIFLTEPTDITWYYNYGATPNAEVTAFSPSTVFVPMLWGMPTAGAQDTTFLDTVTAAVRAGQIIDSVLFLNEPDGSSQYGGSSVDPAAAAALWKTNIEPLKKLTGYSNIVNGTIKLGGPAVTGSNYGFQWLQDFQTACDGGCSLDFLPAHFYGDFEGLASNLGQKQSMFPDWARELWVTEYALEKQGLEDTQNFFNESAEYFDRVNFTERYSYFGSFRSSVSNVGPNVAMLNGYGQLTDIGAFYMGRPATGVKPTSQGSGATAGILLVKGAAVLSAALASCWLVL